MSHQVGEWSRYNFGLQSAHRPAMGMVEELNELQENIELLLRDKILDAVGDVTIYMADYYSIRGWDLGETWDDRFHKDYDIRSAVSRLSQKLIRSHLKGEQNIRGGAEEQDIKMRAACAETLWLLSEVTRAYGDTYLSLVSSVWNVVKKRDWMKHRNEAHTIAEQASK